MRINAGRKGASSSADDSRAGQERPQLAQLGKIVRPAVAAIGGVNDRAFKHDGSETLFESDCEATEQPAAQGVERSAENKSDYGDDGEADKGFDAAAADHPIEHFNGIEGQDQKQHVDRHAKGDDPHQRGSSRNQSKQRSLTRRWDFTTVTRIHERPALSLTEYCRRQSGAARAAPPKQDVTRSSMSRIASGVVDVVDRLRTASAPPVTPSSVMVPKPKSSTVLVPSSLTTTVVGSNRRRGIDINLLAVGKAEVGNFVIAEVGAGIVAEIERIGASTACQHIVAGTAIEHIGTVAAVQLIVAGTAVQGVSRQRRRPACRLRAPPFSVSLPSPPSSVSSPASPSSVSVPVPPLSSSSPRPPLMMSLPAPPAMTSSPASPSIVSLPSPPSMVSAPAFTMHGVVTERHRSAYRCRHRRSGRRCRHRRSIHRYRGRR